MLRSPALLAVALVAGASPLAAQAFGAVDSLLAAGDTSGAIALLEAMVERDNKDAEAHYRAGILYMSRHVPGTALSPNRRKAEAHFRYATRFASDSAKYWLAFAELFRTEEVTTTRVQVAGMVNRAREAVRAHGGDPLGLVEYRVARIAWERYEQFAHRYLVSLPEGGGDQRNILLDMDVMTQNWVLTREFLEQQIRPDPGHPGETNLTETEVALRNALAVNPLFVDAAGLLAVALGEGDRWEEAYPMVRALVLAAPDSGRAYAVLGMVLARLGRWSEAQTAYGQGLARMTPAQRAPYDDLGLILRLADSVTFAGQPPAHRTTTDSLYWLWHQPLYLHEVNEEHLEFFARITYVMHRWSDPLRGYEGYESDRGAVYVRWGPPDVWATLGREGTSLRPRNAVSALDYGRNTIVWVYTPTRLAFTFALTPGYARAVFSGDQRERYRDVRNAMPARFDNVPVMRTLDTIGTQIAQFRREGSGWSDVVVFASTPTGRMAGSSSVAGLELVTAVIVKDRMLRDVVRERRELTVAAGDTLRADVGTWRLALPPWEYRLRLEATLDALGRAARSSETLRVRSFTGDSLQLSDVVAAARVAPRDSAAERWTDFLIAPSAGRFAPDAPVALLWEIYNLAPDSTGLVDYRVDIRLTVQEIERYGFAARFLGMIGDATGMSATGDDQVTLSFDRRREAPTNGRAVEYLDVALENAPEATYLLTVTVMDLHTGRIASAERRFTVSAFPLTK